MADFLDNLRFPAGLDEGDLLAWIEGEPCPAGKRAAIAAWMSREPALARVVGAMRADRAGMQSLKDEPAPAGLVAGIADQVEPLMERQMLLGLGQGENLHDHPPVSVVRPPRQSLLAAFFADRLGRRMAMAAAVLLLVGGSTYFIAQTLSGPGPGPGPVKHRIAKAPGAAPTPEGAEMATGPVDEPEPAMASRAETGEELAARVADGPDAAPEALMAPGAAMAAAETQEAMGPFVPESIDPARAVDLAREGRLVIRVKARDPGLIIRPDRVLTRMQRAQSPAWTVEGPAPMQVAQAVSRPFPADLEERLPNGRREFGIAGNESGRLPGVELVGPPLPTLRDAAAKGPAVYSVTARLDGAALARLRQVIAGAGGEVEFDAAEAPLPGSEEPVLTAPSMLWWGQSPAGWTRWARVPVVVDVER